jgi:hypothetical protein
MGCLLFPFTSHAHLPRASRLRHGEAIEAVVPERWADLESYF